ncbi:OPT oligopeptide transporter [Mycena indigotica]|uniref:OPT oligopeptide transporter n=1 Tax=Mycena indigotica TaxID=2126181 RepID=A0A8H6S9F0_9AGAR|nr:OPT oligopeptide transporter [Mycena indigotica]KAF7295430.1 OPT oligopeptide transporter [Mycena indigotica]
MPQEQDAGTANADVAILTSQAYVDEKKARESESFDDEKVDIGSASELEKGHAFNDDDIVELKGDDEDPAYAPLPRIVRELCTFEDDPTIPVLTWRLVVVHPYNRPTHFFTPSFFVLSGVFTALGAWLTQMGMHYRLSMFPHYSSRGAGFFRARVFSCYINAVLTLMLDHLRPIFDLTHTRSVYFVQIASLYIGKLMASSLPSARIGFGKYTFELVCGRNLLRPQLTGVIEPWTILYQGTCCHRFSSSSANTGATNNLGDYVLAPLAVFYKQPMNGWLAILFMWSAVFIGFSLATLARSFLVTNPTTLFPLTLQQVSVCMLHFARFLVGDSLLGNLPVNAMRANFENDSRTARKQMRVFWFGILIFFLWEFLPEYIFPFTSSLAFLCWVTDNPTANFLGSGLGGAGLLNFTLDCQCLPFVLGAWILVPIGALGGAWQNDLYPMQSQTLYLTNGSRYPTAELMNEDYTLNEALYELVGAPKMSAQLRWAYFFSYTAYLGAFVSLCLFQGPLLWRTYKSVRTGQRIYHDKLNQLMEPYATVPVWWNIALFVVPAAVIIVLGATGKLYLPIYTIFVAFGFGALIVVPMAYIYAVSGYQVPVGYFNELLYGYLINAGGSRHPVGSLAYRTISGQCWYEACSMLSDMKLGHYFHIPPRATLFAQVWGILIGVPVNYATILWVVNTKGSFLDGSETDPNNQWTGQTVISLNNQGIAFALVQKLFDDPMYTILPYGFLLGAGIPVILYLLHRKWPRAHFDKWNVPVRFNSKLISLILTFPRFLRPRWRTFVYGFISNYVLTWFILGSINHLYFKKYKYRFWKTYAYIAGAAADTGFNLNMLILFIAFSAIKVTVAPHWWGNNANSVERCFPKNGGI